MLDEVQPRGLGHAVVGDHQVDGHLREQGHGLVHPPAGKYLVTLGLKVAFEHFQGGLGIVHRQDAYRVIHHSAALLKLEHEQATSTRVPSPGLLSTWMNAP